MFEWEKFASVFRSKPDYTLDRKQIDAIERHRKELGGTLFFDWVCQSVGLKQASKAYPPKSNPDLKALWQKIVSCTAAEHQKHALLYYILKDCRNLNNADGEFARQVFLPRRYELIMTGFWELDHCQFSRALEHLTDPSVDPTFADDILLTLIHHPKCDDSLAMAYYLTTQPPLQSPRILDEFFHLLCRTNVVEAYSYCQKQTESKRKALFEQIIESVLSGPANETRAERALLFLGLPYTAEEEEWFERYLSASNLPGAKDSVLMRCIATGKDIPGSVNGQTETKVNGLNWDDIRSSLQKSAVG